jgi:hypothetical protein
VFLVGVLSYPVYLLRVSVRGRLVDLDGGPDEGIFRDVVALTFATLISLMAANYWYMASGSPAKTVASQIRYRADFMSS